MSDIQELEDRVAAFDSSGNETPETVDLMVRLARKVGANEPKRALDISRRALEIARRLDYDLGIAYGTLSIGLAEMVLSNHDAALPILRDSLSLFDALTDPEGRGRNLAALAQVDLSMGEYDRALANAFKALKLFKESGNQSEEAWTVHGIGAGYHELGDYERALEYENRAMKMFRDMENPIGEARTLSGIGTIYQTLGDYEEAADYHQRALDIFQSQSNLMGEARALNDLGAIYQNVDDYERARDLHQQSLEIRRRMGYRQAESTSLLNLGHLAIKELDAALAIDTLSDALEIATQVRAKPRVYQCHEALSLAYELAGNLDKALDHHRTFHRIKEEVTGEEAVSRVKNLQIEFEVEKSEHAAEIARLKNVELQEKNTQLEELLSELKAAETQLIQAEKMAALGGIVAGIIHELNTPVGVINSAVGLVSKCTADLQMALKTGSTAEEIRANRNLQTALESLEENKHVTELAIKRIGKLVTSLKSFTRIDRAVFEPIDIHEGIETTLTLLETRIGNRIQVVLEYGALPLVPSYVSELNQMFLNLLTNAAQAIRGEGTITIRTRAESGRVKLEFSDTGVGIPEDQLSRLFDPTFSKTGSRVKASLGLIASYNIVEKHSGRITVESEVGRGTTLTVSLPTSLQMWPQLTGGR